MRRTRKQEITGELIVATYNVHHWIGTDGKRDMDRCLEVLRKTGAGIAGLQEAGAPLWSIGDNAETLASRTGMNAVLGATLEKGESHFGNILLSAYPINQVRRHDISLAGTEPRGVLDVDIDANGLDVRAVVTHFGLRGRERRMQAGLLLDILSKPTQDLIVIMGDFNEWFRLSRTLRTLRSEFGTHASPKTFPSFFPLFALDRIWAKPRQYLRAVKTYTEAPARLASDHLPLTARIAVS